MKKISRAELRALFDREVMFGKLKGLTRSMQAKKLGIKEHQVQSYANNQNITDEAIQKIGEYFEVSVDNENFKPAISAVYLGKPRNDREAREKQNDKSDMEYVLKRRAAEEHQAKIYAREWSLNFV